MCGLVGLVNQKKQVSSSEILIAMRDRMLHRGPDSAGIWYSKDYHCALAHRRLSIIDLSSKADQPMSNCDQSVVISFNGEIYNHQEIRRILEKKNKYQWKSDHSDTEVILHAYEEWGLKCLDKFYGMFAFAIYDSRNSNNPQLHLVRDRIGVKPIYITQTKREEWAFSSEIKALFMHPDISAEMDKTAFWHYLTFIVSPAPLTMFRHIWKIPAGYGVTIDKNNKAYAWQWWDCHPSKSNRLTHNDMSMQEASVELLSLLRKSIQRRMVSDVPFGVLLSGGVDSSLIVALMSEFMDRPVKTFTIGYDENDTSNEFHHATRISKRYRTEHHETKINASDALDFLPLLVKLQDEPIADNVCIPLYFLSKLVKETGTTVVQVGEGADENFLGYWWCEHYRSKYENVYLPAKKGKYFRFNTVFNRLRSKKLLTEEDEFIRQRANNGEELFWGGAVCWWGNMRNQLTPTMDPFYQELNCPIENLLPSAHRKLDSHAIVHHYMENLDGCLIEPEVLQKIPYMELKLRLPEHLLMRVDKMTMAHSVEARVPFLDHTIVDFAARLPFSYKLNNGVGKVILKKVAEPFIDHDLLYRPKQGFGAPMEAWFKQEDFTKRCLNAFTNSDLVREGYINREYFVGLLEKQKQGSSNYSFHLWTVLNAVLWYEVWINNNSACL